MYTNSLLYSLERDFLLVLLNFLRNMLKGQAICTSYGMYGICKYGLACKYDHPLSGYYSYSLPLLSIPNQTVVPYYSNSPVTCSSSETSPSKSLNLESHPSKPESTSIKQNSDTEALEDTQQQTTSPSAARTSS